MQQLGFGSVFDTPDRGIVVLNSLECQVCGAVMGSECNREAHIFAASVLTCCPFCHAPRGQVCDRTCPIWFLTGVTLERIEHLHRRSDDRVAVLARDVTCAICCRIRLGGQCDLLDHLDCCASYTNCRACDVAAGVPCVPACAVSAMVASVTYVALMT